MEWGVKEKLSRSPTVDILVNYIIEIVTKRENDKMLKKFLIMGLSYPWKMDMMLRSYYTHAKELTLKELMVWNSDDYYENKNYTYFVFWIQGLTI